jgi:hypothetical protein
MQCWIVEFRDWALAEAQLPKRAQSQGSEQDHYGTDYLDRDRLKGEEIAKGIPMHEEWRQNFSILERVSHSHVRNRFNSRFFHIP